MRNIFGAISLFLATFQLFAQNTSHLNYKVKQGDTLYKISIQHDVPIESIKSSNPNIVGNAINIGDIVRIPTQAVQVVLQDNALEKSMSDPKDDESVQLVVKDISPEPVKATASSKPMPEISAAEKALFDKKPAATNDKDKTSATTTSNTSLMKPAKHIVKKGETLFSIAKVYGIEMQAIRTWNGLKKDELTAGKDLIVGWIQPTGKALANLNKKREKAGQAPIPTPTETVVKPKPPVPVKPMSVYHKKYMDFAKDKSGRYRLKKQRGIATWFDDSGEASSGSNLYALHRSAPLRSIVEVKNPINGRSVYVMVIERLPDTPSNKNVLVSLTLSAAKQLNMLDEKTQVEASYYRTK